MDIRWLLVAYLAVAVVGCASRDPRGQFEGFANEHDPYHEFHIQARTGLLFPVRP